MAVIGRLTSWFLAVLIFVPTSLAAQELEPVKLQLQWKHQFEFAGFYAAKEKGFYERAGLDVELLEFTGKDPTQAVLQGDAEFAVGYSSVVADYLEGQPIVLLANFLKHSPIAVVAQPEIRTLSDLEGGTLMGIANSIDAIALGTMFNHFGLNQAFVEKVEPAYSVEPFIRGEVDAMVVFTSNEVFDLQNANKEYTLFDPSVFGAEYYDVNLITNRDHLAQNPTQVKRFREASIEGWNYALQNQSEIIDLIYEKYNSQSKTRAHLEFEAQQITRSIMARVEPVGSVSLERIQLIAADLIELDIVEPRVPLNFTPFIYREPPAELALSEQEQSYLNEKTNLSYCVDPNWMPFESLDGAQHVGMSADYLNVIAERLNTDFKLVLTESWGESLAVAYRRECDLLLLAMQTPERSVHMNFTEPYVSYPLVIATRMDTLFINELRELEGRKLGIVKGYAFSELLRLEYPDIEIIEVADIHAGLDAVASGELYGFTDSLATIGHVIQKSYIGELKIAGKFDESWDLSIAVRNDDPMLLGIMEKVIDTLTAEEHRAIENNWISVNYGDELDFKTVLQALSILALVFGIGAYHVTRLSAKNDQIEEKNTQLLQLASTDRLTGLLNRLRAEELLEAEFARFQRYNTPLSILLIDVDNFKRVNDTYGHPVGDEVLKTIASTLKTSLRATDQVARWGGEEFLVICSGTSLEEAKEAAQHLIEAIRRADFKGASRQSISLGVAQIKVNQEISDLLVTADKALYRAKSQGRDQLALSN